LKVNGKNVPNYVQSEGNAKFRVNFKPQEAGTFLLSVKFNNVNVPSSPFSCLVTGSRSLSVRGAGIQLCPVGHETSFVLEQLVEQNGISENHQVSEKVRSDFVQTKVASPQHALDVTIVAPSGLEVPFRLSKATAGGASAEVSYTPQEVGPHVVRVLQDGNPVDGSPFTCNVYDAGMIQVTGLPKTCALGKPVTFSVDASKAGEGRKQLNWKWESGAQQMS
jgi:filamin